MLTNLVELINFNLSVSVVRGDPVNSPILRLKDTLFSNYDRNIRPVLDGKSTTLVTFRMLLYAITEMVSKTLFHVL